MKLLVTGFEPFGGESINPSWEAVRLLPDQMDGWELMKIQLPTVFGLAAEKAIQAAEAWKPQAILCIGQAGGRKAVTPEMVAINLRYAAAPDNAGTLPKDEPIALDGPSAYFSTVPVRRMADAIAAAGYPGAVSYSAGAFVCNDLLYSLLHRFRHSSLQIGFIHVPYLPEQGAPSLPLQDTANALKAAIRALAEA